jgi:hypothetical protein
VGWLVLLRHDAWGVHSLPTPGESKCRSASRSRRRFDADQQPLFKHFHLDPGMLRMHTALMDEYR